MKSALALTLALGLAGCSSTAAGLLTSAENSAAFTKFAAVAQAASRVACNVEPTAVSIAALVTASPVLTTADAAARLACAAVTVSPAGSFTASDSQPDPKRLPQGTVVSGAVLVNGKPVTVEGTVAKPTAQDKAVAKTAPSVAISTSK